VISLGVAEIEPEIVAPVLRREVCSLAQARRVAAMLDLDPDQVAEGQALPRGWQFILMGADTRRSALRADGFPGLGVAMPDLGLPRLLLGGREVSWSKDIPIGARLIRASTMDSLTRKTTDAGPMAIARIRHEMRLSDDTAPALVETQTYLLLPARNAPATDDVSGRLPQVSGQLLSTVVPDETLLFQYSALGFNSHKIHIDRAHARNVEGFPGLVVNGGLATLLLTEFLRRDLGLVPAAIKVKHLVPLYCGRPITLAADRVDTQWRLKAYDHRNVLAVDMEVETQ
jgi:3-methylfumaryl-CoA hydratase